MSVNHRRRTDACLIRAELVLRPRPTSLRLRQKPHPSPPTVGTQQHRHTVASVNSFGNSTAVDYCSVMEPSREPLRLSISTATRSASISAPSISQIAVAVAAADLRRPRFSFQ